ATVSTFVGVFPLDAPRYVVLTMLDQPKGSAATGGVTTAGMVSAPIAGRVIARIGPMLGVLPDMNRDIDVSELMPLLWHPKTEANH
ncbi:MAG: penicillin-binding protein 2, partial [Alphaproteobacteria bacterium]|nr:penicillin-binding protein 2 [Alphaproteobacteria bacterium]